MNDKMKIHIKILSIGSPGVRMAYVHKDAAVIDIKRSLCENYGIPVGNQRLIKHFTVNGKDCTRVMENREIISNIGVDQYTNVNLIYVPFNG